jgi:hypothetical protein
MAAPPLQDRRRLHAAHEPDRRLAIAREDPVVLAQFKGGSRLDRFVVPRDRIGADAPLPVIDECAFAVARGVRRMAENGVRRHRVTGRTGCDRNRDRSVRELDGVLDLPHAPGEAAGPVKRPRTRSRRSDLRTGKCVLDPLEALTSEAAYPAVAPHPAGEPNLELCVAGTDARGEGDTDVVEVRIQFRERR